MFLNLFLFLVNYLKVFVKDRLIYFFLNFSFTKFYSLKTQKKENKTRKGFRWEKVHFVIIATESNSNIKNEWTIIASASLDISF